VGKPAPILVEAKDANGRRVPTGGDPFKIRVQGPSGGMDLMCSFSDQGDGTYTAAYTPLKPGFHTVEISLNDEPVMGSPFHPLMEDANAGNSWAEGPGLAGGKTGRHNPITIHAVDADGSPVRHGGDPFLVGISGPDSTIPSIKDNGDGTYSVDYVVNTPGEYTIDITLHGQPIKDSPFTATIKPDVDPNLCYAEGPGLLGAFDNEPATFTIFARDGDDQPKTEGGDPFVLKFDGPGEVQYDLKDNGDGTYSVTYHPLVSGPYDILITLEDSPIKNAPYHVDVKQGTDIHSTGFKGFTFTVQTRDKHGHNKTFGGDKFEVEAHGDSPFFVATTDHGDGTYTATYAPPKRGSYQIAIKFNGRELASSPLSLKF